MGNFYTATVYQKGQEIIRLYELLLGRDGFRKGMDSRRREFCHSAAPPSPFGRCFSRDGEGLSVT